MKSRHFVVRPIQTDSIIIENVPGSNLSFKSSMQKKKTNNNNNH